MLFFVSTVADCDGTPPPFRSQVFRGPGAPKKVAPPRDTFVPSHA